jgi:hypothetical protein
MWHHDEAVQLRKEIRGIYTTLSASRSGWAQKIVKQIKNRWRYLHGEDIQPLTADEGQ